MIKLQCPNCGKKRVSDSSIVLHICGGCQETMKPQEGLVRINISSDAVTKINMPSVEDNKK